MAKGQIKQKLTENTIRKLEEAFSIDASVKEACYYADISTDTYYRWIKEFPELSYKLERLREKPVLKARQTVVKSLEQPDYAFKYLEKKKKDEFGNSASIEIKDRTELEKHKEALKLLLEEATKEVNEPKNKNTEYTENTNGEIGENS